MQKKKKKEINNNECWFLYKALFNIDQSVHTGTLHLIPLSLDFMGQIPYTRDLKDGKNVDSKRCTYDITFRSLYTRYTNCLEFTLEQY